MGETSSDALTAMRSMVAEMRSKIGLMLFACMNGGLPKLAVNSMRFGDDEANMIALAFKSKGFIARIPDSEALRAATQLVDLQIYGNEISDKGMEQLALALPGTAIKAFRCGGNPITSKSAVCLAGQLGKAKALQLLDIRESAIGDEGASALAYAIPQSNIKQIGLARCGISDRGAVALAGNSETVAVIDLEANNISMTGAVALNAALERRNKASGELSINLKFNKKDIARNAGDRKLSPLLCVDEVYHDSEVSSDDEEYAPP